MIIIVMLAMILLSLPTFALECNSNKAYFGFSFDEKKPESISKLDRLFIDFKQTENSIFFNKNGLMVMLTPWIDNVVLNYENAMLTTIIIKTPFLTKEEKDKIKNHLEEDYDFLNNNQKLTFNETLQDIRGRKWSFTQNDNILTIIVTKTESCSTNSIKISP